MIKFSMNFASLIALTRLNKPIGIFLLLWPTWWALWLAAGGLPALSLLLIFTLGVVIMRSAGCIINDVADQAFDGKVARTKNRPLVTGQLTRKAALIAFCFLCFLAFLLVLQLNLLTILLSIVALALSSLYPFMKRFTHFPQVVLGMAWYVGILMAFTATLNTVSLTAWLLYIAAIIWTVIYDTMYAMVDREDDKKIGIKSTAIRFGSYDRAIILILQIIMLGLLIGLGYLELLRWPYYAGIAAAAGFFAHQQHLIKNRLPALCFQAFLNNYWVGLSIFVGIFFGLPN